MEFDFDEYLESEIAMIEWVNALLVPLGFARTLRAELVPAVENGLRRLDRLSRDDPFWTNRNHRPTMSKLIDFARAHPDDRELAMAELAYDLCLCSPSLPDHPLWRLDEKFPIEWLIESGYVLVFASGQWNPILPVARALGRDKEARALIERLATSEALGEWARRELT
jgi:hypothetical protein